MAAEKASKNVDMQKMWDATLDTRTRPAHRKLDGTVKSMDGLYKSPTGAIGPQPGMMMSPKDDCNCRCSLIYLVDGKKPEIKRARNYEDPDYQQKLANKIEKYMIEGYTESQATKLAQKEVTPPSLRVPYMAYEEWYKNRIV